MFGAFGMPALLALAAILCIAGDLAGFAGTVQLISLVTLFLGVGFWSLLQTAAMRQVAAESFPHLIENGMLGPFLAFMVLVAGLSFAFAVASENLENEGGIIRIALQGESLNRAAGPDGDTLDTNPVTTVRIEPPPVSVTEEVADAQVETARLPDDPTPAGPLVIDEIVAVSERQIRPVVANGGSSGFDNIQLYVAAVRAGEEVVLLNLSGETLLPGTVLTPLVLIEDIGDGYLVCTVGRNMMTDAWVRTVRRFGPIAATVNDRLAADGPGVTEDVAVESVCG
ncbi:MAG: hypothetical protein AAFX39_04385 [Pseudomonadota bacterium]